MKKAEPLQFCHVIILSNNPRYLAALELIAKKALINL